MSDQNSFIDGIGQDVFVGRCPVFDGNLDVICYELIFHIQSVPSDNYESEFDATVDLYKKFIETYGFYNISNGIDFYINLTDELYEILDLMPSEHTVVKISEDMIQKKGLEDIRALKRNGLKLMFECNEVSQETIPLFEFVNYFVVDANEVDTFKISEVSRFSIGTPAKVIAINVDCFEQYENLKKEGVRYFQGQFLSKPNSKQKNQGKANKAVVLNLVSSLNNPAVSVDEIEQILSTDPRLSFKLISILNSAAYIKRAKIESVHQAIIYLGLEKLREWASLIVISSVESKSNEIVLLTIIRAKMCALLAENMGIFPCDNYFTLGLFSTLDSLFDDNIENLLDTIPLSDELKHALVTRDGLMGSILNQVIHFEMSDWSYFDENFLKGGAFTKSYLDSLEWAKHTNSALN